MTLHLLFSSRADVHQRMLDSFTDGDAIVLLEQGLLAQRSQQLHYLARRDDGQQQGLLSLPLTWLNDAEWLTLTLTATRTLSWFD
ncbi:hypothetical protein CHH28_14350 [Bacterioplanes sanyensis]|uniref:Sulfurtransferase complex subunit TusB n=1 Tax=Bacterioplanes sanyensis TaxID=1249553 RepID=A0A222FN31_9GAMM|nr:hypothetical protein [Bacterioplanes sanyensis]ASP39781.1 hypothetical protein CHH28_14350 [Bacterioplanes sanyensis]